MIATYFTLIPLSKLFLTCKEESIFLLAFALFGALSRFCCLSAGCCVGKVLEESDEESFHIKYTDPEQLVNIRRNKKETKTHPLTLYEIMLQNILVLLILLFPKYTVQIFSIMSIIIILLSSKYRDTGPRQHSDKAILMMTIFSLVCFGKGVKNWEILKLNKITNMNYTGLIVLSVMFLLITSYDIDFSNFIKS
tara:strand:- start:299 stop:880 length:582 start_codon:yes stop_codon:yes gene_type:complete